MIRLRTIAYVRGDRVIAGRTGHGSALPLPRPPRTANQAQQRPSERSSQCKFLTNHWRRRFQSPSPNCPDTNRCFKHAFASFPVKHPQMPLQSRLFPIPNSASTPSKLLYTEYAATLILTCTPFSTNNHCTTPGSCARPCARGWWADTGAQDASFRPFRKDAVLDRCRARAAAPSGCSCGWCRGLGTWLLGCSRGVVGLLAIALEDWKFRFLVARVTWSCSE
jgi:hypothetical protein